MTIPSGALRFNTDSGKLEVYCVNEWFQIDSFSPDSATGGARGVFGGGFTPAATNVIDYITISTTGNATYFGDLTTAYRSSGQCSSRTRGVLAGGITVPISTNRSDIEYITIASTGNSIDSTFDLTVSRHNIAAFSSSTRGIFYGGVSDPGYTNTIDYITITSIGNAVDFGDATIDQGMSGCSSSTRGVFGGGVSDGSVINFVTIATLGNASTFGSLAIQAASSKGCCSNSIRGLFADGDANTNTIEFLTISTLGNTQDFGDLTVGTRSGLSAASSSTRGSFAGGGNPGTVNIIDYVQIMTIGNAIDFGDLTVARSYGYGGMSNGHGGL